MFADLEQTVSASAPQRVYFLTFAALGVSTVINLLFAAAFARVAPVFDGWHWVELLRDYREGSVGDLDLLLITHNEHPYGLATLIFIYLGRLTQYRFDIIAYPTPFILGGNGLLMAWIAWRSGLRSGAFLVAGTLLAASLRQAETMADGFEVGLPLTILLGLVAIVATIRLLEAADNRARFGWLTLIVLSLAADGLASAAAAGAFPAVVFLLLASPSPMAGARPMRWLAAGCVTLLCLGWLHHFFGLGMVRPPVSSIRPPLTQTPAGFVMVAGSSFLANRKAAFLAGVLLLGAFGWLAPGAWRRGPYHRGLVTVGLFAMSMIATVAVARGLMGGINPGRYATYSIPLAVVTLYLAAERLPRLPGRTRRASGLALISIVGVCLVLSAFGAWQLGRMTQVEDLQSRNIILHHRDRSAQEIATIYPWPVQQAHEDFDYLEKNGLNIFSMPHAAARLGQDPSCDRLLCLVPPPHPS